MSLNKRSLLLLQIEKQILATETLKQMKNAKFSNLSLLLEFHLFLCFL